MKPPANPLNPAEFRLAAHELRQLPMDSQAEVAFAGRSNAGKSSALNALCARAGLARTSKTPGRTQQLVYFALPDGRYLVDLPGYGFAKVSKDLRDHWQIFIDRYFQVREPLKGLVVVMDVRHPLREFDLGMLAYAEDRGLPAHCLLTKADKLGRGEQGRTLLTVRKQLDFDFGGRVSVQLFSAETKAGVDEARAVVCSWLGL